MTKQRQGVRLKGARWERGRQGREGERKGGGGKGREKGSGGEEGNTKQVCLVRNMGLPVDEPHALEDMSTSRRKSQHTNHSTPGLWKKHERHPSSSGPVVGTRTKRKNVCGKRKKNNTTGSEVWQSSPTAATFFKES